MLANSGCGDGYMEMDPNRRYGRLNEVLGSGAMKTVYKAFDTVLGIEVAWNKVKLTNIFRTPDALSRLYSEVNLLKVLNHDSIMRFYTWWSDADNRDFNFITEMFTSGTLRQYRQKYHGITIQSVKNWARQILNALAYLHGHDPKVIHRDLKCDNIFVNGHLGQVKIGDFGLATLLRHSQQAHSPVGTPEFMAPEIYEENYNELVDVYSFGMCVLEMLTGEFPYLECSDRYCIYNKVKAGILPEAFFRIQDMEAKRFVANCLCVVDNRLSANELLLDPFLANDEDYLMPAPRHLTQVPAPDLPGPQLLPFQADLERNTEVSVTGTVNAEDDSISLEFEILNKTSGLKRNITFSFDMENDTAIDVATEMVEELNQELKIVGLDPLKISELIEGAVSNLAANSNEWSTEDHDVQNVGNSEDFDVVNHSFTSNSSHSSSQVYLSAFSESELCCQIQVPISNDESCSSSSSKNSDTSEDDYHSRGGQDRITKENMHESNTVCPSNTSSDSKGKTVNHDTVAISNDESSSGSSCKYLDMNEDDYHSRDTQGPISKEDIHESNRICPSNCSTDYKGKTVNHDAVPISNDGASSSSSYENSDTNKDDYHSTGGQGLITKENIHELNRVCPSNSSSEYMGETLNHYTVR